MTKITAFETRNAFLPVHASWMSRLTPKGRCNENQVYLRYYSSQRYSLYCRFALLIYPTPIQEVYQWRIPQWLAAVTDSKFIKRTCQGQVDRTVDRTMAYEICFSRDMITTFLNGDMKPRWSLERRTPPPHNLPDR